jgi:hypothetical protein
MSAEGSRFNESQGTMTADGDSKTSLGSRLLVKKRTRHARPADAWLRGVECGLLIAWPPKAEATTYRTVTSIGQRLDVILTLRQHRGKCFQEEMARLKDDSWSIFTSPGSWLSRQGCSETRVPASQWASFDDLPVNISTSRSPFGSHG